MPKKEKRPSVANLKKKQGEKIAEKKERELEELGDLFKKSAEKSKTQKHEGHEESGESELEEDVSNDNLNLQTLEFHQFMEALEPIETGAPVLERMALSSPRPIFVGGIPQGTATTAGNEESRSDDFKYAPGTADANEPKYFSEPGVRAAPERIDFARTGRTTGFREEINQERLFIQSEPAINSQVMERFERPERFNIEREERKNTPETEREKYRPKLPKS